MNLRSPLNVADVAQRNTPVLCADTCVILDLLRSPSRDDVRPEHHRAAFHLLTAMEGGSDLIGLMAEQVVHEVAENRLAVTDEATKNLEKFRAQVARVDAVVAVFGATGAIDLSHLDGHVDLSALVVDRWLKASWLVAQAAGIADRALLRVNKGRTPADRGKQSMKDCVVIETYLDVVKRLRDAGHVGPVVFASSNTKDYAATNGSNLKPDLEAEFTALNMLYAPNLAAAKHQLGLKVMPGASVPVRS